MGCLWWAVSTLEKKAVYQWLCQSMTQIKESCRVLGLDQRIVKNSSPVSHPMFLCLQVRAGFPLLHQTPQFHLAYSLSNYCGIQMYPFEYSWQLETHWLVANGHVDFCSVATAVLFIFCAKPIEITVPTLVPSLLHPALFLHSEASRLFLLQCRCCYYFFI